MSGHGVLAEFEAFLQREPCHATQSFVGHLLRDDAYRPIVTLYANHSLADGTSIEDAIAGLWDDMHPIWSEILKETPTPVWHGTATDIQPLFRTHVLRLVKGWKHESTVVRYLEHHPELIDAYGYDSPDDLQQSKLWRAWNKRYSDTLKTAIEETADILVTTARRKGVPAPDDIFRPSLDTKERVSERTERELISKHTKEVWQQAKPFIEDSFYLHRGENTQIPENAWWEQHTYLGMRKDMFAESGADSYRDETTREHIPAGRHHRDKLKMLSVDEIREMVQNTTQALVNRARHNNELIGKLTVAIDITKGHPWTGEVERWDDGQNVEPYILGYKGGERHFQWASIQVVGQDIPLVLDVLPVKRGMTRFQIVDELLATATDIVGGIELVMMDREFDSDSVKDVCDKHDVYYLNPARKHTSERATCTRLCRAGKLIHVTEQDRPNALNRKRMWLPATAADAQPAIVEHDAEDEDDEGHDEPASVHDEMLADFADLGGDVEEMDDDRPFKSLVDEVQAEEDSEVSVGNAADSQAYTLFETNHPMVEVSDDCDDISKIHMVERLVRRYQRRWGIENGFKKIKNFMVRTASKNHRYRYFNFAFACVLYNVWRLVDLLVKLAIDGENASYTPKVNANRFLTHAKKYYGLDPPD